MKRILTIGKILIFAGIITAAVIISSITETNRAYPLIFMAAGLSGLLLMGFPLQVLKKSVKSVTTEEAPTETEQTLYFWEAQIRNALLLGILGTILDYGVMLSNLSANGGFKHYFPGLANSFTYLVTGIILAVVFAVPALKASARNGMNGARTTDNTNSLPIRTASFRVQQAIGMALFLTPVIWLFAQSRGGILPFLNLPAFMVVAGGTTAVSLFMGRNLSVHILSFSFAVTGLIGGLLGLIQTFYALGAVSIRSVAAALSFSLGACVLALLGMLLIAAPMQDHSGMTEPVSRRRFLNHLSWYVFPLVCLFFLCLTIVIVAMPVRR